MEKCDFCKRKQPDDVFYLYSVYHMTGGRVQKGYLCQSCSDRSYGDKWYPITVYYQQCEISNFGHVREVRGN
ncbi:hypothetical protein [Alkalihalobacterium elongatum]|uniref:hypothetical protein n=1 Tax=Alkalihalobacterium elongatum TaxID=2675466 RepID=UPI001C1FC24D|nr:hypothetical protein [Alkalihalobacterium elongatum]